MKRSEKILASLHRTLAKSRTVTLISAKIRNQCDLLLRQRFGIREMSPHRNGEYLLLNNMIPLCKNYFDVGANKGDWTAYILENSQSDTNQFYLYEPGKVAYKLVKERFENNNKIKVCNSALSESIGQIEFYEEENAGELSSAVKNWGCGKIENSVVATTTVDNELLQQQIDYLDYLKIDTEGFDLKVLQGAGTSINDKKIGFIQFEYNQAWFMSGSTLSGAFQLLESNGYHVFLIQPTGLYTYDMKAYGEFYAFSNFIAIAEDRLPALTHLIKGRA